MNYAVIFDMDGLLLDSEVISRKTYVQAFQEYGYDLSNKSFEKLLGKTEPVIEQILKEEFGSSVPIEKITEYKNKLYITYMKENPIPLKKGVIELLEFLEAREVKIGISTSTGREWAKFLLTKANIMKFFHESTCGDEVTHSKPNPEIFLKTAKKLEMCPRQCIVLEDSATGIAAAKAGDMIPYLVPDLQPVNEQSKENAERIFQNLLEVKTQLSTMI